MNNHYIRSEYDLPLPLKRRVKLLMVAMLLSWAASLVYSAAYAAVTGQWQVNLLRSSTKIETIKGADQQATWGACNTKADTLTAATHIQHKCQTPVYVATWKADPAPVCPPQPLVESQQAQCPAGQTGGWTQTRSYASVAAPTCWSAGNWVPVDPPAGACTVPPPVLSQPTLSAVRTDSASAGRHNINLSWTVSENATTYSVERCTVALPAPAPCTNFAGLLGAGALTTLSFANTNLPAGFSYSYRLRGRDGLRDLSSPYSNVVTIVIPAEPAAGTAMISWTPPTQHTDGTPIANLAGYRLEYDDVPVEEAGPTFDKPAIVINNPGVSSYSVPNLAPGAWHFRVKAFNSVGVDSQPSNIAIKTIQ